MSNPTSRRQDLMSLRETRYRNSGPGVFLLTKIGAKSQVSTADCGSLLLAFQQVEAQTGRRSSRLDSRETDA